MFANLNWVREQLKTIQSRTQGFAVAEFAVTLPAILFVTAISMWSVTLCVKQVQLETAAGSIAREISRNNSSHDLIMRLTPDEAKMSSQTKDDLIAVHLEKAERFPLSIFPLTVTLRATSQAMLENP